MKIISSQHFLSEDIIAAKMAELKAQDTDHVVIVCWDAGEIDGEEYAVVSDGHHTLAAARELGLEIRFDITDDPEGLRGEELLDARYMDGDWYFVETSNPVEDKFDLVW